MLIEFSVGNFRSFKHTVTLSMVAANIRSQPEELDSSNVLYVDEHLSLLKSAAIYGANASGKSNIVAALNFMRFYVLGSLREFQSVVPPLRAEPFRLSTETLDQPSHFEIVLRLEATIYRYGFTIAGDQVVTEWLYHTPPAKREGYLFRREGAAITVNQRSFKHGHGLEERTREDALFLTVAAQFNVQVARALLHWFRLLAINLGIDDRTRLRNAMLQFTASDDQETIAAFVTHLDLGIDKLVAEEPDPEVVSELRENSLAWAGGDPAVKVVKSIHKRYDTDGRVAGFETFSIDRHESQGTRRLFMLAHPLLTALREGTVLVIDEIDARLHPLLTREIVRLFNSTETNPHNAQLIFVTHDTNLLDFSLLRRDQIWFVEKSSRGVSDLYSLVEYRIDKRIVRNDARFEKDYIAGRYGAIPYLGDIAGLLGAIHESQEAAAEE